MQDDKEESMNEKIFIVYGWRYLMKNFNYNI